MDPSMISLIRHIFLGVALLFSLIVIGLAGHLLSLYSGNAGNVATPDFLGLSVASAVLTMITILASTGIDFFRKGAFTSMVATELGWTFFLQILWLASAADTTSNEQGLNCNINAATADFLGSGVTNQLQSNCHETQALIAFNWLTWIIMLGWFITLIIFTIIAHSNGQTSVWVAPVNGTDFFKQGRKDGSYGTVIQQQAGAPVQQQYTGGGMQQTYPPAGYNAGLAPGGAQV